MAKGLGEKAGIKIADRIQTGADAIAMAAQRKGLAAVYVMPAEERLDGLIRVLWETVDDLFYKSKAELKAWLVPRADGDTITLPNGEYAGLLEVKHRAETCLAACRAALQAVPEVGAVTLPDGEVVEVRAGSYKALEAIWDALGNFPFERPVPAGIEGGAASEVSLESFVAETTATSDTSFVDQTDGGPVEPELDIDALVKVAA